jgi:tetratricopeptide (TPR) repeat protein/TolB-like protein
MNADMRARWEDVARVVDQALDLELTGRPQFVERTCSGDAVLRAEVDRLLDAAAGAGDYLDHPAADDVAPLVLWVARQEAQVLATGTRFGVYEVTSVLGRGGMATVYLAEDQKHHRMVAVKVFDAEFGAAIGREWFLREIDIAAKLHHPHILPLHDSGEVDGRLYYVMPHVEGESLRQRLSREGHIPLVDARRIVQEVAGALDYAHRQGLVHRDIKPENILLQDGQAIVADFGIARAIVTGIGDDGTAETLPAIGTPAYMSPEQAMGSTRVDVTTDVYALGCVLYEMLSGQPPFLGPTPRAILAQHALDPVPPLQTLQPTVPLAFAQVVTQALAKVPADRFPTARAFAEALAGASVALEAPGDSAPATVLEAGRVASRRRRWILVPAAALAAAGLAALLTRKPADVEPSRVLVLPFENRTGDSTLDVLGNVVADYVTRGLRVAHYVREVVDGRSRAEGGRARNLTPTAARGLARDAGSGTIVLGSYDRTPGDSVQLQAEVLDTRTGRALRLIGPVSAPVEARLAALTGVRTRVMAAVSSLLDWDFSEETSLPETYEALEEWRAGSEAWMHCGGADCEAQGIAHMRRAAAIDSNFTLPLAALAFRFMGSNCPLVDSVAAELQPRLERLPPEDGTQLSIATFLCHGDLPNALDRANDPRNERMGGWKAMLLLYSNRPREVIPILAPLDESRARDPERNLPMLLDAYHRLGQYDSALAFVARMRRIKVNNSGDLRGLFLEEEAASLAGLGRVADVATVMDRMVRQLADDQEALVHQLELTGLELAAHGHAAAAQQASDRAITWLKAQSPDQQASPHARRGLAYLLNSAGRWDEALAIYRSVTAPDSNDFDGWATLGDLAARRGDRAEAERIERLLTAMARRGKKGAPGESWALYGRARIAGLLGERARAIGLLRQAAQMGFSGWPVAHRDPDLAPLRADPAFQDWIRPKD